MRHFMALLLVLFMLLANDYTRNLHTTKLLRSEPTDLDQFLEAVARRESNNNHMVINQYGMLGKYQFSPSTIRGLGFKITNSEFLSNPKLQDSVMVKYLRENNKTLKRIITQYEGKVFKGVRVTRAGVLAAAHLAGAGGVRNYFSSDDLYGRRDGNGTSVRDYMHLFNNYKLQEVF